MSKSRLIKLLLLTASAPSAELLSKDGHAEHANGVEPQPVNLSMSVADGLNPGSTPEPWNDLILAMASPDAAKISIVGQHDATTSTATVAAADPLVFATSGVETSRIDDEDEKALPAEDQFQPIQRIPGTDEIGRTFPLPSSVQPIGNSTVINTSLTYSSSEISAENGNSTFSDVTLNLEPVFRTEALGGLIFRSEARGTWTDNSGAADGIGDEGFRFQRGATTLTRDFTDSAMRLTLGDIVSMPQNFQTAQRLLGVQVGTNYQAIHPYRVVFPSGRQIFQLDRPARVQIFADGVLVAQQLFQPGQFDIEQFATRYGTRNIELSVRDDTGGSTRIELPTASGIPRLTEGLLNYGVAAGVISNYDIDGPEYLFDQVAASGFVDYGLTPNLTIGTDFQIEPSIVTIGARSIYASEFGALQARASLSIEEDESDVAVGLQYQSPPSDKWPVLSLDAKYYGEDYPSLSEYKSSGVGPIVAAVGDPKLEFTALVSDSLSDSWRVSAGGNWTKRYPDTPGVTSLYPEERWSAYISSQFEISRAFRFSVNLSATQYTIGDDPSYGAMFTLSHKFGPSHRTESSYETRRRSSTLAVSSDPFESIDRTSWQLRAQSAHKPGDVVSLSGEFDHAANRFNAYGLVYEDRREGEYGTTRDAFLQVETALGITDSTMAIGRPVRQRGFAIVKAPTSGEGGDVYVDDWGAQEYRAKTSFLGPALVSDVLPYTNSRLELSLRTSQSENDITVDDESIAADILDTPVIYAFPYGGVVIDLNHVAEENKDNVALTETPTTTRDTGDKQHPIVAGSPNNSRE
jgi:outer membrane usher protein FimD/PapC